MKILYLLRSAPDETVLRIIELQKAKGEVEVVDLAAGGFSYDALIDRIFSSDKVISW